MCNSIMAVAHRVMLTCDLVYNRCHCDIKQHLSSIWKSALETGTTGAFLGSTWRSSMSSRRSTPPSGCTSTSCATNQTLPMGSWQSTGVLKRDHLVDLLINTGGERYFKKYLALLKDGQQILGNGPHKLWDRPDVVRLSCHWWIHPCSHGKLIKVDSVSYSIQDPYLCWSLPQKRSVPAFWFCSWGPFWPHVKVTQNPCVGKLFYADRILFDQGGLQKDNQRQLGLAGQEKPDMISFCHIMWHGNDFIFATWKVLSHGNVKYIFFALHITWCLIKLSIFYYQ